MPEPDYLPPPSHGSGTGLAVGIVAVIPLLVVVCGVGLLGFRFLAFRTVETRLLAPIDQEQIEVPLPPRSAPFLRPRIHANEE
jgi:hypothetical protein